MHKADGIVSTKIQQLPTTLQLQSVHIGDVDITDVHYNCTIVVVQWYHYNVVPL